MDEDVLRMKLLKQSYRTLMDLYEPKSKAKIQKTISDKLQVILFEVDNLTYILLNKGMNKTDIAKL